MKLTQTATVVAGHPFRGKIPEVVGSGVVAVQMKDLVPGHGIHWPSCTQTNPSGKREPDWLQLGDILFTARGSNNFAVLVDETLAERRAVAAPQFYIIRCTTPCLLPGYLVWLLNQRSSQRYFRREAEGSLTKSIRRGVLDNTPIVVPELAKQRAIVGIANILHRERQLIEQLIRNGENLMNTIADQLLRDSR